MLQLTPHNVGTAPGTTTLTIPTMAPTPRSLDKAGIGLGTVYPTDFDLAKIYGFLPYTNGWISGKLNPPWVQPPGVEVLGDAEAASMAQLAPEQQLVALQAKLTAEEIASRRTERTWTIVAGLVGVAGLVVSVIALRRS